jgi:hypothetical protein
VNDTFGNGGSAGVEGADGTEGVAGMDDVETDAGGATGCDCAGVCCGGVPPQAAIAIAMAAARYGRPLDIAQS